MLKNEQQGSVDDSWQDNPIFRARQTASGSKAGDERLVSEHRAMQADAGDLRVGRDCGLYFGKEEGSSMNHCDQSIWSGKEPCEGGSDQISKVHSYQG